MMQLLCPAATVPSCRVPIAATHQPIITILILDTATTTHLIPDILDLSLPIRIILSTTSLLLGLPRRLSWSLSKVGQEPMQKLVRAVIPWACSRMSRCGTIGGVIPMQAQQVVSAVWAAYLLTLLVRSISIISCRFFVRFDYFSFARATMHNLTSFSSTHYHPNPTYH